ncbi:thiopeptide-type bacteriocin [Deinococcus cellulosilyticus]|uniref:Uncharacterized protein n=1 Tax=Deinococcus cellulosilyticus (strain DSM 18568 / NBRC 106333 / KACC 11606 / 5516J-15) TaxID=1223518 RepID=A0A511N349_DEIC1|nr:thiopeptide-type bacteriocin [Deinococcus cellulosilyticus]GEM46888.1 hypothetical protein DC3_25230 [Deinococcus cellulosilyticus NBRC 106333 = KACC 11606]
MHQDRPLDDLDLRDLDLSEVEVESEDDTYALPEAGASVSWNSCSSIRPK